MEKATLHETGCSVPTNERPTEDKLMQVSHHSHAAQSQFNVLKTVRSTKESARGFIGSFHARGRTDEIMRVWTPGIKPSGYERSV